jgi:ornithine cyclodeaminase
MPDVTILTEKDLIGLVPLDRAAVDCVADAFKALATEKVVMPPILSFAIAEANGEVDVKTAYVPGIDSFAIKISPGFFDNPKIGLPSLNGLMTLFSARTGLIEAVLLDNGYLTDIRTAAAGAVAADRLAKPDASRVAILGTGLQARLQLEALTHVRDIQSAVIWGRDPEKAKKTAGELAEKLGFPVTAEPDAETAVKGADIVVTTTPATEPILMADWIEPGQHVTAMGSDAEHKNEIDPALVARADLYVADRLSQTRNLGELHHALAADAITGEDGLAEIGPIIAGTAKGRQSETDITLADLTGTGVQDTAIATLARQRAQKAGAGTIFSA